MPVESQLNDASFPISRPCLWKEIVVENRAGVAHCHREDGGEVLVSSTHELLEIDIQIVITERVLHFLGTKLEGKVYDIGEESEGQNEDADV